MTDGQDDQEFTILGVEQSPLELFFSDPLWYLQSDRLIRQLAIGSKAVEGSTDLRAVFGGKDSAKHRFYRRVAELLREGKVALGKPGQGLYRFDDEREPITAMMVHHTLQREPMSKALLSAMTLMREYAFSYRNPSDVDRPRLKHAPIYSDHFEDDGQQVFYPYHWLIEQNGDYTRLLRDDQIAWHANSWAFNKRSVAIAFNADLSHSSPSEAMIEAFRTIVDEHYGWLGLDETTLLGQMEVDEKSKSPGGQFLKGAAWKYRLL